MVNEQRATPTAYHPEDVVVDHRTWSFVRVATAADRSRLMTLHANGPELFDNQESSIVPPRHGESDLRESLALVSTTARRLWLKKDRFGDKPKFKAAFYLAGTRYELPITDPVVRDTMENLDDGEYDAAAVGLRNELVLTISLSEPTPYDGRCYKLVAAIIQR